MQVNQASFDKIPIYDETWGSFCSACRYPSWFQCLNELV